MKNRKLLFLLVGLMLVPILIAAAGGSMVVMPGKSFKGPLPPPSSRETELRQRLQSHVMRLAGEIGDRSIQNHRGLNEAAGYLEARLKEAGLSVRRHSYQVSGKEAVNVEGELRGSSHPGEIVVIGAHYDSVAGTVGANDNASGVAALLELARAFGGRRPARTLRFVGFTNEEPPWFLGETMGSLVYARQAKERGEKIVAMISLETIGYYSDERKSQQYPAPLGAFYPDTGNFIGFVSDWSSRELLRTAIGTFRKSAKFPSEGVAAPSGIPGIGWSDHWSFWQVGYPAIMVTDTAPFRYPHYHQTSDTPDKLDYDRMSRVVSGLEKVVAELVGK